MPVEGITKGRERKSSNGVSDALDTAAGLQASVSECVLRPSQMLPQYAKPIRGLDLNNGISFSKLIESLQTTGFQASSTGKAIDVIRAMRNWRPSEVEIEEGCPPDARTTIFLGYTSNLVSSGVREVIRYLVEHKLVSCLVSTAGGIEEDLIKCLAPTYLGDFDLNGVELRARGVNRIGNLLVPNDNYCLFEDWIIPILNAMLEEQRSSNVIWTPQKMIDRLGKEINDESSILYWAHKNEIPVFCPALTDGSIGDMLYMHSFRHPGLIVDINQDIRAINSIAVKAKKSGVIILGGGIIKHHICNANLMRNGADFAVYVNTGQEFDGSDSGAKISEAVSTIISS